MTNIRRISIIAAVAFAAITGMLLFLFLRSYQTAQAPVKATVQVLVANANIDKGLALTPPMFARVTRDKQTVDPDAVGDPKSIAGRISLISMPVGSVLTSSKMGAPNDVSLSVRLKPGERAISISVDRVKDISGLLLPGDRVDVLAQGPRIDNRVLPTVAILRGIMVLAVGNELETAAATPSPNEQNATTVTLAVNPKQAEILMTADQNATIRLALRSPKEGLRSEMVGTVLYNGTTPRPPEARRADPPTLPPVPRTAAAPFPGRPGVINGVTVIEGSSLAGMR
jgi:pilus assembly protein CpaB